jgi:carboxymethylenebutenolidase
MNAMKAVTFKTDAGTGTGELFSPDTPSGGSDRAVALVPEWWGLNDHIRSLARRLAKEGFTVLAVDIFHGKSTTNAEEAGKLMGALDTLAAVADIAGAAAYLREAGGAKHVGVTGFCLGGALTLAAACHIPGLSGAVAFYGIPRADKVDYGKVTAPIQAHFATRDEWASVDKAKAIQETLKAAGKEMELCVYDADHAFVNDTRPEVYSKENAELAWARMVAFFKTHPAA